MRLLNCDADPGGGAVGAPMMNGEAAVWADRILVALADLAGEITETDLIEQVAVRFADRFGPSDRVYAANADRPRWHDAVCEALRSLVAQGLVHNGDSPTLSPTGRDHLDAARAATAEATTGGGGQVGSTSAEEGPLLLSGSSGVPIARGLAAGGPLQDGMPAASEEVMAMRRYLLVLDMDLLTSMRNSTWNRSTTSSRSKNSGHVT